MSTRQAIQQVLLSTIVTLGVLGNTALAQPDFFDDFSDGDPTDGSPVTWHPIFVWDGTGFTMTPEGLDVAGAMLSNSDGTIPVYHDVAITTEIRRHANDTGAEWASGFLFRYNANWSNGYWMEVRPPNRFLLGYSSGAILGQATLPFNVDEQAMMIHMEAEGNHIKGWCWAKDQARPEDPQISVINGNSLSGQMALHAWIVGGQSVFRSVEVHSIKTPIVDLNGDGAFNVDDLAAFIETWGQDDPVTDYWRDGTVDKKDLTILMDCWGQPLDDPTLQAHWALDESEGDTAADSQGLVHATVMGDPLWQPDAGAVGGSIELDGEGDYLVTDTVINPKDGPFSLVAWVKGGAPGQTIVSQANGENWLCLDPVHGSLMTEIKQDGRSSTSLCSDSGLSEGNWHRVALVWDGEKRTLYLDDECVAQDPGPNGLADCPGGLIFGRSNTPDDNTYFNGMIDDVRVYDRVIRP